MAKKINYPLVKKVGWRFLRTFISVLLVTVGSGLVDLQLTDFEAFKALLVAGLSAALVALGKAVREYIASDDYKNLIHKLII